MIVADHLERFSTQFFTLGDTTLHAGRNFAVAPDMSPYRLTVAGLLASLLGRLCSHPLDYPGGRYPLPFELNHACPDFPPHGITSSDFAENRMFSRHLMCHTESDPLIPRGDRLVQDGII